MHQDLLNSIEGHILDHIALHVIDEATQALVDGLFNERLDDVVGFACAGTTNDLDVHMEGVGREPAFTLWVHGQGVIPEFDFFSHITLPIQTSQHEKGKEKETEKEQPAVYARQWVQ